MTLQTFGKERSQRFNTALKQCPYARLNELVPLLLLLQREDLRTCTLLDMASGTGYVTDLLRSLVRRVIRVDKSPEMMAQAQGDEDMVYADVKEVYALLGDSLQADIITCLAALHHVSVIEDGKADPLLSERLQSQVIEESAKLLAPGGRLLFIDVCLPELPPLEEQRPFSRRIESYYQHKQDHFRQHVYPADPDFWSLLMQQHPDYFLIDSPLAWLPSDRETLSLNDVVEHQRLHYSTEQNRTLVVDFFDEVVARYSIDGHIAHFPREPQLRSLLEGCGLQNVLVTCLPTPWQFRSEVEAVWFVRELFSLGEQAMAEPGELASQPSEYQRIKTFVDQYLGMSTKGDLVSVNWQLVFAYGERSA